MELGPQEITIDNTNPNQTIIYLTHTYDIGLTVHDVIGKIDLATPIEHAIIYNNVTKTLVYRDSSGDTLLHTSNIIIERGRP